MSSYSLRLRGPKGLIQLPDLTSETSFIQLLRVISQQLGPDSPEPHCIEVRAGFPPKEIYGSPNQPIQELVANRETLIAKEKKPDPRLLCASPENDTSDEAGQDIPSLMEGEGQMVRRIVPSDNSCLFASIRYVFGKTERTTDQMRQLVSQELLRNSDQYDAVVLGEDPIAYGSWILEKDHWGGSIEISVFAQYYQTEIAVSDVKSGRLDIYGQDKKYPRRVYLLYDGIHYDPLAFTFDLSLPKEADVTLFSSSDQRVQQQAQQLTTTERQSCNFTDVAEFTLRCQVCRKGLKGMEEAQQHASQTSHQQFAEYR